MSNTTNVLQKAEEFIDYKVTEVTDKREELLTVESVDIRKTLATEVVEMLDSEQENFDHETCKAVGREYRELVNIALSELDRVSKGLEADLELIDSLIIIPSPQ